MFQLSVKIGKYGNQSDSPETIQCKRHSWWDIWDYLVLSYSRSPINPLAEKRLKLELLNGKQPRDEIKVNRTAKVQNSKK